jgi:hypothetical protein
MNEGKKTTITVTVEDGKELKCVLREPDFATYCNALNVLNTPNNDGSIKLIEAGDTILMSCLIADESDTEVLTRPDVRVVACQAATGLLKIWSVDVKKN